MFAQLISLPVSVWVTEGLAKMGGFEVLRHGTTIPGYIGIIRHGSNPFFSGCSFHVWRDPPSSSIAEALYKRTMAKTWSIDRGASFLERRYKISNRFANGAFGLLNLFCPTVRFLYRPKEREELFNLERGVEAYTKHILPPDRIGLCGILSHLEIQDITHTWKKNPSRVLFGIAQLTVGIWITYKGYGLFF